MRCIEFKEFNHIGKEVLMQNCLAIDVAKGKSMVALISSNGEVLIEPYEFKHSIIDFSNLLNRICKYKLDDISVIMESTGIYHRPVERFFLENNFNVFTINPIYGKMYKRNLRKTKTDKEDCYNLANLFFNNTFRKVIKPNQLYLDMNALSRQYFVLEEKSINLKNRFKELIYLSFPEYDEIFKQSMLYSNFSLLFIEKFPHADIIKNTRIDHIQNFLKKSNFRHFKVKARLIKDLANNSYPSISKNDEIVSSISQIARLIRIIQKEIDTIKQKIILLAKNTKYFEPINSIYGIGEFTTSIIIAELGDINRFNNIKELTAYCGLDPSIKQSGKSINVHGPISKSGNKYIRHILFSSVLTIIKCCTQHNIKNDIEIYYRKKRNEGKHHYVATIACTTKLLRKILALCKQLDK